MSTPQSAPYGSWKSPITADMITAKAVSFSQVMLDGADIYWAEGRPEEGGRVAVVRLGPDGQRADVTPATAYVRSRVHEYGGGAYLAAEGTVYYTDFQSQRLFRVVAGGAPEALSPDAPLRFADMILDRARRRLIAICEDHGVAGQTPTNSIVAIALDGGAQAPQTLVAGHDFFAAPRLSPDGSQLAWQAWDFPNMPWDGNTLNLAPVNADGSIGAARIVAGGADESIFQPQWSPDGTLFFISDRTNWWNLYRWRDERVEAIFPLNAEFGDPQWMFRQSNYAFESAGRIVAKYVDAHGAHLALLDLTTGTHTPIQTPYTSYGEVHAAPGRVVLIAGAPDRAAAIIALEFASGAVTTLRRANESAIPTTYLAAPQSIEYPSGEGQTAFGYYYPPTNPDFQAPAGELPPLLVRTHGGPTSAASATLNLGIQYWTSRGFAVLDVNYGGSTGFGREYRNRLRGQWGIVDVRDSANGALYLASQGLADRSRLAIDGGSAGGYTTLAALAFSQVFSAGASYYGVSDPELLAKETHKFESRYCDLLIAPYPAQRAVYDSRSPLLHAAQISRPVIFFQGLDDPIVLPNQSELMVDALRRRGIPVAYVAYPGESHGFRKAENIKDSLEKEFYFYSRVFGFTPADPVPAVTIENL